MEIRVALFANLTAAEVHDIARLRQDVFVVEQACPYPDLDGRDTEPGTGHVLLHDDGVNADSADNADNAALLGYARVLDDGTAWRIGRVALARSGRGRGIADGLMDAALDHCRQAGPGRDVVLDAQSPLTRWYAGFGFVADGPEFLEDGIPHTPMRLSPTR